MGLEFAAFAIGGGLAGAAAAAGGGAAPAPPNYAAATKEGIVTNASLLPYMKSVDAAAKLGIKITVTDPETGEPKELDFTGLGDGDTAAAYADKMAAAALEIQKQYGPAFIEQSREQLKLADPEGWAARERLNQEMLDALGTKAEQPIADTLEAQILAELQRRGDLPDDVAREIEQALTAQQSERGGGYGKADEYARAMGTGLAVEQRRTAQQQKAAAFLSSGHAKTDRDFRKRQQDMANLSAFLTGQTPTAQFQQLSGAQQGAAPSMPGQPGPTLNPNAGAQGAQYAQNQWQTQANIAAEQVPAWMGALNIGGQALGTAAVAGGPMGFGWWGKPKAG